MLIGQGTCPTRGVLGARHLFCFFFSCDISPEGAAGTHDRTAVCSSTMQKTTQENRTAGWILPPWQQVKGRGNHRGLPSSLPPNLRLRAVCGVLQDVRLFTKRREVLPAQVPEQRNCSSAAPCSPGLCSRQNSMCREESNTYFACPLQMLWIHTN